MSEPAKTDPPSMTESELLAQDSAIERLLRETVAGVPTTAAEPPADLLIELAAATPDQLAKPVVPGPPISGVNRYVDEFKPTDEEWENVKELEFPGPHESPLEAKQHPSYKPEILERDAQGFDGDWSEVEPEPPAE